METVKWFVNRLFWWPMNDVLDLVFFKCEHTTIYKSIDSDICPKCGKEFAIWRDY